ncbi:MAG TPA: transcription termination/antitermination NusG family protein [Pyrinomonadaceae bacterium]|jgi:transcriptional antiterminator RfaH
MNNLQTAETPHWYVIHTHPKQEERADMNLRAWKVETCMPKFRERRYNQATSNTTYVKRPLFPGYLFARFRASDMLSKVRYTRGVHSIVSYGSHPTPLDDEIIASIKLRSCEDGFVKMSDELKSGDCVLVRDGLWKGFTGVFERHMQCAERVMVLLNTVSYQSHIVLERGSICKAD